MSDLFIGLIKNICPKFGETAAAFLFVCALPDAIGTHSQRREAIRPAGGAIEFELVVNLKTIKALGIELPPTSLAPVDAVIKITSHIAAVQHPNSD